MDFVTGFCLNFKADCYNYPFVYRIFRRCAKGITFLRYNL
ncbi:hypothetical protein CUS_7131 [Ruminococcus albus 8]|uniref:Uncharacterized protein n=1 Tax=Ruminococcus albus 8 TaxID=246199 RepID=E9SDE6_RUMAL|nr:hypothetical protein CUS_7131 [Ruminococcus albus 8]